MQYITMLYVLFHTGLGIINSTSLLQQWVSESQKRWGCGRRQYKVGVNRRICVRFSKRLFKVGVKTRKSELGCGLNGRVIEPVLGHVSI